MLKWKNNNIKISTISSGAMKIKKIQKQKIAHTPKKFIKSWII